MEVGHPLRGAFRGARGEDHLQPHAHLLLGGGFRMRRPPLGSCSRFEPSFVDQHVCLQLVGVGEITWTKLALKEKDQFWF